MRTFGVGLWLVLIAFTLIPQAAGSTACLVLSGNEPERLLARLPIEENVPFCLEFVNSIYLAPVRETFVYRSVEGFFLVRVESPSAGVFEYYGLMPDGSGSVNMRRRLGDLRLLSHDYQHHRLVIGDRTFPLKGLVADGQPLTVRVRTGGECEP
jgi:hypothetical protein